MKRFILLALTAIAFRTQAQTFPDIYDVNGNVGIGVTNPTHKFEVGGTAVINGNTVIAGELTSSITDPNIGGRLVLANPTKTGAGQAMYWRFFNMSGSYGNSLQLWTYDATGCATGGMCANRFTILDNGYVGIGTSKPQNLLDVAGTARAKKINVTLLGWSDFVFDENYQLPSLQQLEADIKRLHHLPNVPSTEEVLQQGLDVGEMQQKQMQKIEELTLYIIEQNKKIEALQAAVAELKAAQASKTIH